MEAFGRSRIIRFCMMAEGLEAYLCLGFRV